mmetsp:Transcript_10671/g.43748  ORF Transcript_10671/g.43748 Transcript_10671/m.43748 type:complete len:367 (+) Transcript_10671:261-1361(+)
MTANSSPAVPDHCLFVVDGNAKAGVVGGTNEVCCVLVAALCRHLEETECLLVVLLEPLSLAVHEAHVDHGVDVAAVDCLLVPPQCLCKVHLHSLAVPEENANHAHGGSVSLRGGHAVPPHCLLVVLRHAEALVVEETECSLTVVVTLRRRLGIPERGLLWVCRAALALFEHHACQILADCVTCLGAAEEALPGSGLVLGDTFAVVVEDAEVLEALDVAVLDGTHVPPCSSLPVLLDALPVAVEDANQTHGPGVVLCGSELVPPHGLAVVPLNSLAVVVEQAHETLGLAVAAHGSHLVPLHGLDVVSLDALTVVVENTNVAVCHNAAHGGCLHVVHQSSLHGLLDTVASLQEECEEAVSLRVALVAG